MSAYCRYVVYHNAVIVYLAVLTIRHTKQAIYEDENPLPQHQSFTAVCVINSSNSCTEASYFILSPNQNPSHQASLAREASPREASLAQSLNPSLNIIPAIIFRLGFGLWARLASLGLASLGSFAKLARRYGFGLELRPFM
jgi:hypothetical protein